TQVVGQRLIKQTILFDGRYAHYHMYYANANAEPGSVMTTFPYKRVPGRKGSGQIQATAYTVPKGTIPFWVEHLDRHKVPHGGAQERFGQAFIRFVHPSGLELEVVEDQNDKRKGWTTEESIAMLEPITVPESNGPVKVEHAVPVSRRTEATFVGGDVPKH